MVVYFNKMIEKIVKTIDEDREKGLENMIEKDLLDILQPNDDREGILIRLETLRDALSDLDYQISDCMSECDALYNYLNKEEEED